MAIRTTGFTLLYHSESAPKGFDSEFCLVLGQQAVHAGLAERTDMVVGYWNQYFIHLPMAFLVASRKQIDPQGGRAMCLAIES